VSEFELQIADLSHDGRGVARLDGKAIFVVGALAGERVRVRRTARHKQYDEAEVVAVLEPSPLRAAPRCAHYGVCGGCNLQHLDSAAQIAAKQDTMLENLQRIGHVVPERVLPALTGEPWGYRRRARLSAKLVEKKGRVLVGFRERNGRYVADIQRCEVLHPSVGARVGELAALVASLDAARFIAQIEVSVGDAVTALVFRHLADLGEADLERLRAYGEHSGLAILLQSGGPDTVRALHPRTVQLSYGLPHFGVALAFEPLDFVQVNGAMNERMIEHALALLAPRADDSVLDLFCGLGNFTLPLARKAGQVVGVEGDAGLVARARENAARNGLSNCTFHTADLAADQADAPWAKHDYAAILLDPARAGAEAVLRYLPRRATRRVVYVSCHPGSLARDAGVLVQQHGFTLRAAGVMDMFPHTAHVESIALFER
jgi:23S rRNA (uracil1939-C5)-methyltransferase